MHTLRTILMSSAILTLTGCQSAPTHMAAMDDHDHAHAEISPYAGSYTIENHTTGTEVKVTVADGVRRIVSNGLPNHTTGTFPNGGNPNSISAQHYAFELPLNPKRAETPTPYNVPQPYGIATNGVKIDPFAAEWYHDDPHSGWQKAALASPLGFDAQHAHVQPNGSYHYHGPPMALLTHHDHPELIGWAGDGFPIYGPYGYKDANDDDSPVLELKSSYRVKQGERANGPGGKYDGTYVEDYEYVKGLGDLDECNGRFGVTPEFPNGTYYYVATNNWPYFGRYFAGTLANSFELKPPPGGLMGPGRRQGPGGQRPGGPPRIDFDAAAKKLGVTPDALREALGDPRQGRPDFAAAATKLGVTEQALIEALGLPRPPRPSQQP